MVSIEECLLRRLIQKMSEWKAVCYSALLSWYVKQGTHAEHDLGSSTVTSHQVAVLSRRVRPNCFIPNAISDTIWLAMRHLTPRYSAS